MYQRYAITSLLSLAIITFDREKKGKKKKKKKKSKGIGLIRPTYIQPLHLLPKQLTIFYAFGRIHTFDDSVDDFDRATTLASMFISQSTLMHYWHRRQLDIAPICFFLLFLSFHSFFFLLSLSCIVLIKHNTQIHHHIVYLKIFFSIYIHPNLVSMSSPTDGGDKLPSDFTHCVQKLLSSVSTLNKHLSILTSQKDVSVRNEELTNKLQVRKSIFYFSRRQYIYWFWPMV